MAKKRQAGGRLTPIMKEKLVFVFLGTTVLFLILAVGLLYWMLYKGKDFETNVLGQQNHSSTVIPYERGKIYDRNGNVLATNEKIYQLVLEPKNILIQDGKYEDATIDALHEYFGFDKEKLRKNIEDNASSYYIPYGKSMTYDEVEDFENFLNLASQSTKGASEAKAAKIKKAAKVKGVVFEESYKRVYPYSSLACRILGFTVSGNVGSWGIEQYYNTTLNGVNGRSYYYLDEELNQEQGVQEAQNGNSVVSTIDMQVQQIIEKKIKKFDKKIGSEMTSVLVMNPQNGEILGMASSNPYDLNNPTDEKKLYALYSKKEIKKIKKYTEKKTKEESTAEEASTEKDSTEKKKKDKEQKTMSDVLSELWRNTIISDTNEPGSTYKPFTVAVGLDSGVLLGNENYFCTGSLSVGGRNIGCSHVHGDITLKQALANSCNVAMMNIAFKEGADTFYDYQTNFGFGRATGVDLPGEESGLTYDASNYENSVTLATNAFGQNINCTMLQLAAGFASLINGGNYYQPHVAKEIQNDSGDVVEEIGKTLVRKTVSEDTSEKIRAYLTETVENGTGTKAQIEGYKVGGKTGTAEKIPRNKEDYYVSFIGFTGTDDPELLVYVTIDEPHVEHQANAGLAVDLERECMEEIIDVLGIEPNSEAESSETETDTAAAASTQKNP